MKRLIIILTVTVPVYCFDFTAGMLAPLLVEIISNTALQLAELKSILDTAQNTLNTSEDHLELMKEIHEGLSEAMQIRDTSNKDFDFGLYKNWTSADIALRELEQVYGQAPKIAEAKWQKNTDKIIAETFEQNQKQIERAAFADQISESFKERAHDVSPKGAQKTNIQTQAMILQGINDNLRAQTTANKLKAVDLANKNAIDKKKTQDNKKLSQELHDALNDSKLDFKIPRF